MKTSAGAPEIICVKSALDESEFIIKWQLFACSKSEVMFATTWTKLEAMSILRSTGGGVGDGDGLAVGAFVGDMVGVAVGWKVGAGDAVGAAEFVGVGDGVGVGVGEGLVLLENVPLYMM
jgi:hypothetical protein